MEFITMAIIPALWFGILTSISPCPLATNIAAISFIGKDIESKSGAIINSLFYTFGRMLAYLVISFIVVSSLLTIPEVARFLSKYFNIILGPLLILAGLFLIDVIKLEIGTSNKLIDAIQKKANNKSIWGSILIGFLFALSFCPVSAGLFFGSLIPLSIKYESAMLLPLFYGIGTALPVIVFAIIISFGTHYVGIMFNKLTKFELWARKITGIVFILIGLYISYDYLL